MLTPFANHTDDELILASANAKDAGSRELEIVERWMRSMERIEELEHELYLESIVMPVHE